MDTKPGFGLLGTGLVAPFHAKSLINSKKAKLIAAVDIDPKRLKAFCEEYDCRAYATLEEMLGDDRISVVNVLTPNHLHFDAVMACAAAGKHVLVEKPPAMSLKDTDIMIRACRDHGVKFGVSLQCRVRKAVQAVKRAIDSGRFGRLLHADAFMKWYRSPDYYHSDAWRSSRRFGAGVTIQHAFHYIDLLYYLAGSVKSVQAQMSNLAHPDVRLEDTLLAFLEFSNGARGVVEASTAFWPGTELRIEINGTDGNAIIVGERIETWKFKDEQPEDETIRNIGSAEILTGASGPADFAYFDHQAVIEDMVEAIQMQREPIIAVPLARGTLEIALAMYKSARENSVIYLPLENESNIWDE
ncbi:Gfo/Idh/MocA family oxidoreductase [candidate division KSB1 bacterium]|nr:Gfo/Idh/MocA family oxidoreductase [candidate division KSB1 bacterium]